MHEVLEGRDGYDLIFQELSEKTFDLISSLYKSLNNYGFLCLAIKEDWSDVPKIILSSKDLEISYRQEKALLVELFPFPAHNFVFCLSASIIWHMFK